MGKVLKLIPVIVFLFAFASGARAAAYDFYVDASSQAEEKGTEAEPFKTIGAVLTHIQSKSLDEKTVYVKKGTYLESVELINGTDLVGEDRYETKIDASGQSYGIHFLSTASQISNLTVEKARVNLKIDKKSKVTVANCSMKDAESDGIEVDRSSSSDKRKLTMRDSSVRDSDGRGMYIFKRKIAISGSDIEGNGQEGIDLHTNVRGKISGNNLKDNKESGIEMIMAGAKTTVKGNTISGNDTQGLSIQIYDSRRGKIKITRNHITDNNNYGIRYARYDHGKLKMRIMDFIKKCVKKSGNTISGNGSGDYVYQ